MSRVSREGEGFMKKEKNHSLAHRQLCLFIEVPRDIQLGRSYVLGSGGASY